MQFKKASNMAAQYVHKHLAGTSSQRYRTVIFGQLLITTLKERNNRSLLLNIGYFVSTKELKKHYVQIF